MDVFLTYFCGWLKGFYPHFESITSMIACKPSGRQAILFLTFLFFSLVQIKAQDISAGKTIYTAKCAACHNIFKDVVGPALMNLESRGKWADHKELLKWVNSPATYPADDYITGVKSKYPSDMLGFPDVTQQDVDNMVAYINDEVAKKNAAPAPGDKKDTPAKKTKTNKVLYAVIALLLALAAFILMRVNSRLKRKSEEKQGIARPYSVPFYRNKVYIALFTLAIFVVAGYFVSKGAIGLGRQKNYQPIQPIYYSHKVHAGINQVNCLYCHGAAWESKHATIPSVNVCMNCHKTITTYEKGPRLYDVDGNEVDGTAEIAKLHEHAGFDPNNPGQWDPSQAKAIEWVKVHNLPDHVYFNHSQHVRTGKVQCQSCHGDIAGMDEVKQVSDLSMGWCVNCHRQTKVDFNYSEGKGNQFYSIYERFHNDIKKGKMDSVTVEDIGGLECQKCHY